MSGNNIKGPAIAAAVILLGFLGLFFVMPPIMLWLADEFSPWIAAVFGVLAVLSFFLVFWLRARHQRKRDTRV
jgi:protein-S-isoprenylcysteine O-methyltransferase Ste14